MALLGSALMVGGSQRVVDCIALDCILSVRSAAAKRALVLLQYDDLGRLQFRAGARDQGDVDVRGLCLGHLNHLWMQEEDDTLVST